MSSFNVGDVVVHKSNGGVALVIDKLVVDATGVLTRVSVNYATNGQDGVKFRSELFLPEELETQLESIDREAELFKVVSGKQKEINGDESRRPIAINHLN